MERDIKAIKELLRTIQGQASDAKILAAAGLTLPEQFKWRDSLMHFKNLTDSLEWVVKNTEDAISAEAAKRAVEVE